MIVILLVPFNVIFLKRFAYFLIRSGSRKYRRVEVFKTNAFQAKYNFEFNVSFQYIPLKPLENLTMTEPIEYTKISIPPYFSSVIDTCQFLILPAVEENLPPH